MNKPGAPLEGDEWKLFAEKARRALRTRMRGVRRALPEGARAARSERIVQRLLDSRVLEGARGVGLFWPMDGRAEVDLRALDAELERRDVARFYPFMDPKPTEPQHAGVAFTTGFRRVDRREQLVERGRGFLEPAPDAPAAERGELDVILVPALAATPEGARLGYGAGFYDVTLPDFRPPARAVIVAFAFQIIAELPLFEHDVTCDGVVTDEALLDPRGALAAAR